VFTRLLQRMKLPRVPR